MTDDHDFNKAGFKPPSASNSATEDDLVDLVSEEDSVVGSGLPKKLNTKPIKRVAKQGESKAPQVKIMYNSEADKSQRPKPKKAKMKVWDEINIAVKKIEGTKYGRNAKLMASRGEEIRVIESLKSREDGEDSQDITRRKRKLRSVCVIANLLDEEMMPQHCDPSINT